MVFGCTYGDAMSKRHEEDNGFSRRDCLKNIGLTGAGIGIAAGSVSAKSTLKITEIHGGKRSKVVADARASADFDLLTAAFERDGVSFEATEVNAFRVNPTNGRPFELVSFVDDSHENGGANIAIPLGGNSSPNATVTELDEQGLPIAITKYGRSAVVSASTVNGIDGVSTQVSTFSVSDTKITKKSHDLSGWFESQGITTQGYCGDFPDVISCGDCKTMVTILNGMGCSLQTAAYCAVITAQTVVGPLACAAGVGVLCLIIFGLGISNPQNVCESACAC